MPKKGRVISGEMFFEVGRCLSPDQFKCLLRWIMTAHNPTIVRRKGVKYPLGWDDEPVTDADSTVEPPKPVVKTSCNAQRQSAVELYNLFPSKCDHNAPKIRSILRNNGWIMSSTPTGH